MLIIEKSLFLIDTHLKLDVHWLIRSLDCEWQVMSVCVRHTGHHCSTQTFDTRNAAACTYEEASSLLMFLQVLGLLPEFSLYLSQFYSGSVYKQGFTWLAARQCES